MRKQFVLLFLFAIMFISTIGGTPATYPIENDGQIKINTISTEKVMQFTGESEDIPDILIVFSNSTNILPAVDNWLSACNDFGFHTSSVSVSSLDLNLSQYDLIIIDASVSGSTGSEDSKVVWRELRDARVPFLMTGHAFLLLDDLVHFSSDDFGEFTNVVLNVTEAAEKVFSVPYSFSQVNLQNTVPVPLIKYNESLRLGVPLLNSENYTGAVYIQREGIEAIWSAIENPSKVSQIGMESLFDEIAYLISDKQDKLEYIYQLQHEGNDTGGWSWNHIPTLLAAYEIVDGLYALNKSDLLSQINNTVKKLLDSWMYENDSETLFRPDQTKEPDYTSTSMALILISELGISEFNVTSIAHTIASSQTDRGGFVARPGSTLDRVHETYLALRALELSNKLDLINTTAAIEFLKGQQHTADENGISEMIGGIAPYYGSDESSTVSSYECVYSLDILNSKDVLDIQLLRNWILNNASVNDGSFYSVPPYQIGPITITESPSFVKGTVAALGALALTGGVPSEIHGNSSAWLSQQQLSSGGFNIPGIAYSKIGTSKIFADLIRPSLQANITTIDYDALVDFGMSTYLENVGFDKFSNTLDTLFWTSAFANTILEYYDRNILSSNLGSFIESVCDSNYFVVHVPDSYLPNPIEYYSTNLDLDSIWVEWFAVHSVIAYGGFQKVMSEAEQDQFVETITSMQILDGENAGAFRQSRDTGSITGFQYTVAATDLLWSMGKLNEIANRQLLEAYLLNNFNAAKFDTEFTYPYSMFELAPTYFGTLAYRDLNLLNKTLADTIRNYVLSKVNWSDLGSTYYAVETLGLLQDAGFIILSDYVNFTIVRTLIESQTNNRGLYYQNNTLTPQYTEMIYRLHTRLNDWFTKQQPMAFGLSVSGPSTTSLGSSISLDLDMYSISGDSVPSIVTLQIDSFGNRTITDFAPNGTITISIPSNSSALGDNMIKIKAWSNGSQTPAAVTHDIYVSGAIDGVVSLDSDEYPHDYPITGHVEFNLTTGAPINDTTVKIAVYNSTYYTMRTYYHVNSPFEFSVNFDLSVGNYTFELTISHQDCTDYIYNSDISIFEPILTELSNSVNATGHVNEPLNISGYLTYENGTAIDNDNVTLTVKSGSTIIFTNTKLTNNGWANFTWTPNCTGEFEIILEYAGNGHVLGCSNSSTSIIYKLSYVSIQTDGSVSAGENVTTLFHLYDEFNAGIANASLKITLSYGTTYHTYFRITNASGFAILIWNLDIATDVQISVEYSGSSDHTLYSSHNSTNVRTISDVKLDIISLDISYPNVELLILVHATGTDVSTLSGQAISLRIFDSNGTQIIFQTLYLNSTNYASLSWIPSNIGDYQINVSYTGDLYHYSSNSSRLVYIRHQTFLAAYYNETLVLGNNLSLSVRIYDAGNMSLNNCRIKFEVLLNDTVIHVTFANSSEGVVQFSWMPENRGAYTIRISYAGNSTYAPSEYLGKLDVFESVSISYEILGSLTAGHQFTINATVRGTSGPINLGHILVSLKHSGYIVSGFGITNASGVVLINIRVNYAATYTLNITLDDRFTIHNQLIDTIDITQIVQITIIDPVSELSFGSTLIVKFTLENETTGALIGEYVVVKILNSTGAIVFQSTYITEQVTSFSWKPSYVDLYTVELYYAGKKYFSSTTSLMTVAVKGDAHIEVHFSTPVLVGHLQEIRVVLIDNSNGTLIYANITVEIYRNNSKIYSLILPSNDTFLYTFNEKGIYEIHAMYNGSILYASTETVVNLEADIKAIISITLDSPVYLTNDIYIQGVLKDENGNTITGVNISFDLLSPAYLPLQHKTNITYVNGTVAIYFTPTMIGLLKVRAYITPGQFYIGEDAIQDVVVKTKTAWDLKLQDSVPLLLDSVNFTVFLYDALNQSLDSISAYIGIYDPAGNEIYGSVWTSWSKFTTNTTGVLFSFIPQSVGKYIVKLKVYSGDYWDANQSEFAFDVYSCVFITLNIPERVPVNETFLISGIARDAAGNGLGGLLLSGRIFDEHNTKIFQWTMITSTDGTFSKAVNLTELETYLVSIRFYGYLLYLPTSENKSIDAVLGTHISVQLPENQIYAGDNVSILIRLEDTNGASLEGFMIKFSMVLNDTQIMSISTAISNGSYKELYILFEHSGNYSVSVEFPGTTHYLESSLNFSIIVYSSAYLNIGVNSTIYLENTTIPITLVDDYNNPISNATITYRLVGNISVDSEVQTDDFGKAYILLPITEVGNYVLTLNYSGAVKIRGVYVSLNLTVLSHVHVRLNLVHIKVLDYCTVFLFLHDDLNRTLNDFTIALSLYNPKGREIYGSAFSTITILSVPAGGLNITWFASLAGRYQLVVRYDGSTFYPAIDNSSEILVLYRSYWTGKTILNSTQGQNLALTYHLYREDNSTISNADVNVLIYRNSQIYSQINATTDFSGILILNVEITSWGNYTIILEYSGNSEIFASAFRTQIYSVISPELEVKLPEDAILVGIETNITIHLLYNERYVDGVFNVTIKVMRGGQTVLVNKGLIFGMHGYTFVWIPEEIGEYNILVQVSGNEYVSGVQETYTLYVRGSNTAQSLITVNGDFISFLMVGIILAVGFVGERAFYNRDLLKYPWSREDSK